MMSLQSCLAFAVLLAVPAVGFSPVSPPGLQRQSTTAFFSPLFQKQKDLLVIQSAPNNNSDTPQTTSKRQKLKNLWKRIQRRSNTLESANLPDAQVAGIFGTIKKIYDPKTFLLLAAVAGFRWDWCFRSVFYWFAVGFCIKWYRARYVFKIPVWDRQPNWNNVITSKEQEKDLKAFTCKNCGSTIFIAKTREFFFEGNTGIGGLGCFSCGAKGKDNFVMDRDRIVEDVADVDDYFDYERPLDFVSRAERRKVLKEAQGDEEKANQLLVDRANAEAGVSEETPAGEVVDAEVEAPGEDDGSEANGEDNEEENPVEAATVEEEEVEETESTVEATSEETTESAEAEPVEEPEPVKPIEEAPKPAAKPAPKPATGPASEDDFDILGLD